LIEIFRHHPEPQPRSWAVDRAHVDAVRRGNGRLAKAIGQFDLLTACQILENILSANA
jgi:hypothetical protein